MPERPSWSQPTPENESPNPEPRKVGEGAPEVGEFKPIENDGPEVGDLKPVEVTAEGVAGDIPSDGVDSVPLANDMPDLKNADGTPWSNDEPGHTGTDWIRKY